MKPLTLVLLLGFSYLISTNPLLAQQTEITVFVRDAANLEPIQDAEVSYFDRYGRKVPAGTTNSEGYLRLTVPFDPGEEVLVKVSKYGSHKAEQIKWLIKKKELGPNTVNFYLRVFVGIKVSGHVYNAKSKDRQRVSGAVITVPNPPGGTDSYKTTSSGAFDFNTQFNSGQNLPFRIEAAGFQLYTESKTIQVEGPGNNVFDFYIKPIPKFDWCKSLFYGSGGTALISIGAYWRADVKYEDYKDFNNENREDDYDKANNLNRVSIVSGGLAIGMLTAALICKNKEKKSISRRNSHSFVPHGGQDKNGVTQLGLAYNF